MTTGSKNPLSFDSRISLRDGKSIPQLGFGVYEISGSQCRSAVKRALQAGIRHIDSAEWYGNELECGQAIREFIAASDGRVKREDVFYTSKLMTNSSLSHARKSIQKSLEVADLGYIDLYLLHSPYPDKTARLASWTACEEARKAGLIRSIGVSNFGERHLQELIDSQIDHMPVVNQIDVHPFMTRSKEVAFNQKHDIKVEAWGPLARAERMEDPTLVEMARRKGKSVAQIMIRWSLQMGFICIPKSTNPARIKANTDVYDFTLTEEEMQQMNSLDEYLVSRNLFNCDGRLLTGRSRTGIPLATKECRTNATNQPSDTRGKIVGSHVCLG